MDPLVTPRNLWHYDLGCPPSQDYYIFRIGNPNLNLHLPHESWEGGQPKVWLPDFGKQQQSTWSIHRPGRNNCPSNVFNAWCHTAHEGLQMIIANHQRGSWAHGTHWFFKSCCWWWFLSEIGNRECSSSRIMDMFFFLLVHECHNGNECFSSQSNVG